MANQRLNVKLLAWTALTFTVLGLGIHFLHGYQAQRHLRDLLAQADQAEKQGRFDQAAVYLNRALVFAPDDGATLARYALALDRLATTTAAGWRALAVLEKAAAKDPSRQDVRHRLVARAVELDLHAKARTHLQDLLKVSPGDGELEGLLGRCLEAAGKFDSARAAYEKAIKHAPAETGHYVRLALLLRNHLRQPAEAGRVVDRLVKANPHSASAHLIRADYHRAYGPAAEVARDIARARQLAPDDAAVLWASASLTQFEGRLDDARRTWRRARDLYPGDVRMVLGLAGLELQAGRKPEAADCLRRGLQKLPDHADLLHTLADLLLQEGKGEEAGRLIARLRPDNSSAALAGYLNGRLLLDQRRWAEAARALQEAAEDGNASVTLASRASLYLAQCYQQLGDPERQLSALENAVKYDPQTVFGRLQLGDALLDVGRIDQALQQYREAVKQPSAPAAGWTHLAHALVLHNLRLPAPKRDWREVEAVLARAELSAPETAAAAVLRADIYLAQGKPKQARALLEKARDRQPNQVVLWTALANLTLRRGEPEAAARILDEARGRLGDRIELRLALVGFWVQRGARSAAQPLRALEKDLGRFPAADQAGLLRQLVLAHARLGDTSKAEELAKMAAERDPDDLRSRLLLLDVALQGGRDESARAAVQGIRRLEGETGGWWRYGKASRQVLRTRRGDQAGLAKVRTLLKDLRDRRPDWARVALLEAYIDELAGDQERALAGYLKAVERGERQPGVIVHTAQLLAERSRYLEADRVISMHEEQALPGNDLARFAAVIALRAGRPDRARDLARMAVSVQSRDYRDHLWLAGMLEAAGSRAEAEEVLRRAVELGERIPDTWVALVTHLARAGHTDRAEDALRAMSGRLAPAKLSLALAQCNEALGHLAAAEEQYQSAVARRPDDFAVLRRAATYYLRTDQPTRAEPILRKLLDPAVAVPDESLTWSRRQLALVLAWSGGASRLPQALALLDQNRTPAGEALPDQRARALVLATRPDRRPQALQILRNLNDRAPLTTDDRYRLAHIYEMAKENLKAQAQLRRLVEEDPHNPAYLAAYGRSLLRLGQVDEVPTLLAQLVKLEPNSARTKELKEMARRVGIEPHRGDRQ